MVFVEELSIHLPIVIIGSVVGSTIFAFVLVYIFKHTLSSYSKYISEEMQEKATKWLHETIKNAICEAFTDSRVKKTIGDSLEDPKVKNVVLDILDVVKEKLIKEEDNPKHKKQ